AVADQVDENLLDLDSVQRQRGKLCLGINLDTDAATDRFFQHQVPRFIEDGVEPAEASRFDSLPEQGAYSADDVGRGICVADDALDGLLRPFEIGRVRVEPALTGMRVGNHRGERLVDL